MRYKALPASVRSAPQVDRRPKTTTAPATRGSRVRDTLATLPIILLVPALLLPFLATSASSAGLTVSGTPVAGQALSVSGSELPPRSWVKLDLDGIVLATARTTGQGSFDTTVALPVASAGDHVLSATESDKKNSPFGGGVTLASVALTILPSGGAPTPTPTPAATPAPTPAPTATPAPTPAPTPAATPAPTPTPTPAATPAPTPTPTPAATPTPTPTASCSTSLQSLVNAAAAGSIINVGACTYHETVTIGKALTIRGPATITGDSVRTYGIVVNASDVTIDGLTVVDTMNPPQDGAVRARNVNRFIFKNGRILRAAGACIHMSNSNGSQVLNSELAYCAQEGFSGSALTDTLYAGNHIHHNNPNHAYDPYWEAGAGKVGNYSSRITFDGNEVDHNGGPGLWCDIACSDITFTNNRIYSNEQSGIFFEISTGATISNNVIWDNGWSRTPWGWGAGILVASGGGANIYGNTLAWNADGIVVLSQGRADRAPSTNNTVHDNVVVQKPMAFDTSDKFLLGWLQDWSGSLYLASSNNTGYGNRYWNSLAEPTTRYAWSAGYSTLSSFIATPGEENGQYLTTTGRDQALNAVGIPLTAPAH